LSSPAPGVEAISPKKHAASEAETLILHLLGPRPAPSETTAPYGLGHWIMKKQEGAVTEAELKQFIALEVHALVTPLLSGVHQLLDEVRAAEKTVFETAQNISGD